MFALLTHFHELYVRPADGVEDPDPALVELHALLQRLLVVASATQQALADATGREECPFCGAHELAGAMAHADECAIDLLAAGLAGVACRYEARELPGGWWHVWDTLLECEAVDESYRQDLAVKLARAMNAAWVGAGLQGPDERIAVTAAGRDALARPCALELDEVAGG